MGEQSPSQPHPDTQLPMPTPTLTQQPNFDSTTVDSVIIGAQPVTEISNVSSPPSKMPLRPRKIRKVTPDTESPDNQSNSSQSTISSVQNSSKTTTKTKKAKPSPLRSMALPRVIARSLSCEGEVQAALHHLRNADPIIACLIDIHPPPTFETFYTPFLALTRSILYQQLAFKAGTSIYTRFVALCGGETAVVPETVINLSSQQLRQIGVSGRKASYLHDLSRKYQNGILSDSSIISMDDKSLFTMLTMVNGIGSWSVHMFMIFSLHRPDVLPISDLGIRKGVQLLYGLDDLPRPSQLEQLCEKWRPYRSVASWYLWRFSESKGTPSSAVAMAAVTGLQQPQQLQLQNDEQQHQPQLLDQINGMFNIGAWGQ